MSARNVGMHDAWIEHLRTCEQCARAYAPAAVIPGERAETAAERMAEAMCATGKPLMMDDLRRFLRGGWKSEK